MALYIRILLFTAVTVAPSCALKMTFSQRGDLFFYTISDGPAGADCDYSYYNATDHPMANNYDKEPSLVLNSSLDGLVALKCIEHLFFKATCGKWEHYSANVTVACEDLRSNEDAAKRINPVTKGNMHNSSSMPPSVTNGSSDQTVLVVLVVLVVPVVLAFVLVMWCKYKKKCGTNGGKNEACCGKIFERFCGPGQEPGPAETPMLQLSKTPPKETSGDSGREESYRQTVEHHGLCPPPSAHCRPQPEKPDQPEAAPPQVQDKQAGELIHPLSHQAVQLLPGGGGDRRTGNTGIT